MRKYLTLAFAVSMLSGALGCGEGVATDPGESVAEGQADSTEQALVNTGCTSNGKNFKYQSWTSSRGTYALNTTGWCIYNESANRRAVFQSDGNLVVYTSPHSGGSAVWSSNTFRSPQGQKLYFQNDGAVVLYDTTGAARFNTGHAAKRSGTYSFEIIEYGQNSHLEVGFYSSNKVYTTLWRGVDF